MTEQSYLNNPPPAPVAAAYYATIPQADLEVLRDEVAALRAQVELLHQVVANVLLEA